MIETHLRREVARVLGLSAARLDVDQPLNTMGIDSLTAIDLKHRIEADLQVSVPLVKVIEGPSVAEMATLLLCALTGASPPLEPERPGTPAPPSGGGALLRSILALGKEDGKG
jgi:aryl carrier-like protein